MEQSVPKRLHIKFGRRGITHKKEYNRDYCVEICGDEFYVWVSVHRKLIYIKNQRDAAWQYVY